MPRCAALILILCASCSPERRAALCDPELESPPTGYTDADTPVPPHFLGGGRATVEFMDNTPVENEVTNAGAQLGRVLFHDVRLSGDNSVSCASCHRQAAGFGDTTKSSQGIHGRSGPRRTLPLANARFNSAGRFFWDERAASLEHQVLQPVIDTLEMGMPPGGIAAKLASTSYYPDLFVAAFGSREITEDRIARALAQFVRTLVSARSQFDAVFATGGAPDRSRLSPEQWEGERLFSTSGCVNCHRTVAQIADQATNNGLDALAADTGAGKGRFKPASLRNVAVRPPYMHDGRFATLRDVVEFYSTRVMDSPDLDPRLRDLDGSPRRLSFTPSQTNALVAFLGSLTDSAFLREERFSNPFRCDR